MNIELPFLIGIVKNCKDEFFKNGANAIIVRNFIFTKT